MNSVDRNDAYPVTNNSGLDSVARNDPYSSLPVESSRQPRDVFYYFRFAGSLLGILVVLTGLYFAVLSFDVVRGIIESPQKLNSYLDEWYIPPKEAVEISRAPEPGEPVDTAETEAVTTPALSPEAAAEQSEPPAAETKSPAEENTGTTPSSRDAKLEKLAVRSAHHDGPERPKDITTGPEFVQLLTDALTRGGLPRLAGALVILLLVSMLIRIPFGLIKAGVDIVRASLPERKDA